MKELLKALLNKITCNHVWEVLLKISNYDDSSLKRKMPNGFDYVYTCKKCGKIKMFRL